MNNPTSQRGKITFSSQHMSFLFCEIEISICFLAPLRASGRKVKISHHFQPVTFFFFCSPLAEHRVPLSILLSIKLAPGQALCAILDLIQLFAHPWQSLVSHPPLAKPCVPSSISFSFSLAPGQALCAILDLIQFFARPWSSLVCHPRSHSVLCSPLAEPCVPSSISLSFTFVPGRVLCAILHIIQFYARP